MTADFESLKQGLSPDFESQIVPLERALDRLDWVRLAAFCADRATEPEPAAIVTGHGMGMPHAKVAVRRSPRLGFGRWRWRITVAGREWGGWAFTWRGAWTAAYNVCATEMLP